MDGKATSSETEFDLGSTVQLGQVVLEVVADPAEDPALREGNPDSTLSGAKVQSEQTQAEADRLSAGQQQVLRLLLQGLSEKQVATELCLSQHTVHTHIKRIYKLLDVRSRGELMALYMKKTQELKL